MADIAKCNGEDCKKRDTCYRYTAKANPWAQCYQAPEIIDGVCHSYIEDKQAYQIKKGKKQ
jgi:hypothetical protein